VRNQPHGPQWSLRKPVWIEPVLAGPQAEATAGGDHEVRGPNGWHCQTTWDSGWLNMKLRCVGVIFGRYGIRGSKTA
jgi:hypothetical protein